MIQDAVWWNQVVGSRVLSDEPESVLLDETICKCYFWIKYDLGQKSYAPEVRPDRGSNS